MSDIRNWSEVAANNAEAPPAGFPEGMKRSDVNNAAREMMRAIRKFFAAGEFIIVYRTVGDAWNITRQADLIVRLSPADAQTTDISGRFPNGSRIKITSAGADLFGFVVGTLNVLGVLDITVVFDKAADVVPTPPTGIELGFLRDSLEKTAFYPTGSTLAQEPPNVPTIDDLGDQVLLNGGHDPEGDGSPGIDADKLDGQHASEIIASAATGARNITYNGEFMLWQRGTPIDNDTTLGRIYTNDNLNYTADRWKLLSGTSTSKKDDVVDVSRNIVSPPPFTYSALTFTGTAAAINGDFAGVFQILEARDAASLIGSTSISMGMDMKQTGGITNARFMLFGWDGAADAPTPDPISDWQTAGDVTGPTPVANWIKLADSTQLTISSAWVRQTLEAVDISVVPNIKNLGIFIYIDNTTLAVGDTLHVANVKVETGGTASQFNHVEFGTELTRCQRYFWSSFDEGNDPRRTAGIPETVKGTSGASSISPPHHIEQINHIFSVDMFKIPVAFAFHPTLDISDELLYVANEGDADLPLSRLTEFISKSSWEARTKNSLVTGRNAAIYTGLTLDAEF